MSVVKGHDLGGREYPLLPPGHILEVEKVKNGALV